MKRGRRPMMALCSKSKRRADWPNSSSCHRFSQRTLSCETATRWSPLRVARIHSSPPCLGRRNPVKKLPSPLRSYTVTKRASFPRTRRIRQHSSDLSALSLYPRNRHAVVLARLVAHPGDQASLESPERNDMSFQSSEDHDVSAASLDCRWPGSFSQEASVGDGEFARFWLELPLQGNHERNE